MCTVAKMCFQRRVLLIYSTQATTCMINSCDEAVFCPIWYFWYRFCPGSVFYDDVDPGTVDFMAFVPGQEYYKTPIYRQNESHGKLPTVFSLPSRQFLQRFHNHKQFFYVCNYSFDDFASINILLLFTYVMQQTHILMGIHERHTSVMCNQCTHVKAIP